MHISSTSYNTFVIQVSLFDWWEMLGSITLINFYLNQKVLISRSVSCLKPDEKTAVHRQIERAEFFFFVHVIFNHNQYNLKAIFIKKMKYKALLG